MHNPSFCNYAFKIKAQQMEAQPKEKNRDYITDSNLYILIIPKLLGWHLSLAIPNQILQYPPLHIFDH